MFKNIDFVLPVARIASKNPWESSRIGWAGILKERFLFGEMATLERSPGIPRGLRDNAECLIASFAYANFYPFHRPEMTQLKFKWSGPNWVIPCFISPVIAPLPSNKFAVGAPKWLIYRRVIFCHFIAHRQAAFVYFILIDSHFEWPIGNMGLGTWV